MESCGGGRLWGGQAAATLSAAGPEKIRGGKAEQFGPPRISGLLCPQGWAGTQGEESSGAFATGRAVGAEPFQAWKAHFCGQKPAVST